MSTQIAVVRRSTVYLYLTISVVTAAHAGHSNVRLSWSGLPGYGSIRASHIGTPQLLQCGCTISCGYVESSVCRIATPVLRLQAGALRWLSATGSPWFVVIFLCR